MKKTLASFSIAALASLACGVQAQTVLAVSTWLPPAHPATLAQKDWCDLVSNNSQGRIKCNHLPRAVSAPPGTFDAVKNGQADLSYTVHGYTPGRFLLTQMAEFPFLGNSAETISVAYSRVSAKYPEFNNEHQGVKVLTLWAHGPGIVFNTKHAISKIDELQGLKFRIGGGMVNEITKSLGMNVTLKPATDSYELLSSGVMDGTLLPAESTESFKIDKIIKHATTFPGGLYNTSFVFMMNQGKYDKLSAEDKKVVDAASGEVAARMFGRHWDKTDRRAYAMMQANGVKVTQADAKFVKDVKAKTDPLEKTWATAAEGKGLKNAAKVLAEFRAEIAKLEK
ncbi:MAG: TRAP transporter substrate-binding protein [Limnohabitans sp.]|jgi:TRAP-type C4-dicarboxylate transport system substrate-binding protein|nr:MAG: TRAP transporter substrate-binding protein [Limnohabitans sp.]